MDTHYISADGVQELGRKLSGREDIVMGIRPFGFHAGNMASLVVYPILLSTALASSGKEPRFHFHCWFNDVEQHATVGHDGKPESANLVNVYPAERTLQFTPGPAGFKGSIVDYWQPLIENALGLIKVVHPRTQITFHRTSEMRTTEPFAKTVVRAITSADFVADTIGDVLGSPVQRPAEFVRAVCPECKVPVPRTKVTREDTKDFRNSQIEISCPGDGLKTTASVAELDWWVQFRLLTIPRGQLGRSGDLRMMGADHLRENKTGLGSKLAKIFGMKAVDTKILYAPLLLSYDGKKMGKSNDNVTYAEPSDLLLLLAGNKGTEIELGGMPYNTNLKSYGRILPPHMEKPSPQDIRELVLEYRLQAFSGLLDGTWPPRRAGIRTAFGRGPFVWRNPHA